jgi:hypothetical protein
MPHRAPTHVADLTANLLQVSVADSDERDATRIRRLDAGKVATERDHERLVGVCVGARERVASRVGERLLARERSAARTQVELQRLLGTVDDLRARRASVRHCDTHAVQSYVAVQEAAAVRARVDALRQLHGIAVVAPRDLVLGQLIRRATVGSWRSSEIGDGDEIVGGDKSLEHSGTGRCEHRVVVRCYCQREVASALIGRSCCNTKCARPDLR